jgi:hypothetical protein
MKQSGIDGVLVGLAVVITTEGARLRRATVFLTAFAITPIACAVHGAILGWSSFWNALAGYQFSAMGGTGSNLGTRWSDFVDHLPFVAWDLGAMIVIAAFGFRKLSRDGRILTGVWLAAGFIGINLGGSYWTHYYMQPLPPLVLLAAGTLVGLTNRTWRVLGTAILTVPTLVWMLALTVMSDRARERTIPYYQLYRQDHAIAAAVDASTDPDQRIYVLESEAPIYFLAQRRSPYPYLWGKPIEKIPAALPELRSMLTAPDRPTLVIIMVRDIDDVDPTGAVRQALATSYHVDRIVDGIPILRANRAAAQ